MLLTILPVRTVDIELVALGWLRHAREDERSEFTGTKIPLLKEPLKLTILALMGGFRG